MVGNSSILKKYLGKSRKHRTKYPDPLNTKASTYVNFYQFATAVQ